MTDQSRPSAPPGAGQRAARDGSPVYDVRIRTAVSSAFTASFPVRVARTVVPRKSVYRLRIAKDRDIADVVQRLSRVGVDVLDISVLSLPD